MRKAITAAYSVGSAALILSGVAYGQIAIPDALTGVGSGSANVGFGQITSVSTCEAIAGLSCSEIASGTGFLQLQIDDTANNTSYIQTVITDSGFSSEDFVQMGGTGGSVNGISSRLQVSEGAPTVDPTAGTGTIGTGFSTTSAIYSGWAAPTGVDSRAVIDVNISQQETATGSADDFIATFQVDSSLVGTTNTVSSLVAEQVTYLGQPGTAPADKQHFKTVIESADAAETGYSIPGGDGNTVSWAAGEQVQITWVGQAMDGLGNFGSESVTNVATGTAATANSTTDTGPFDWHPEFTEFGAPTF